MKTKWVVEKNANKWMARAISNLELAKTVPDSEKIFMKTVVISVVVPLNTR